MKLPDLHRVGAVPDWETVPRKDWNEYQIRAAATNGWDTPGNRETLKGALSTLAGLALIYADTPLSNLAGTAAIGYGRWKDIEDGKRAHETGTKSPLGEIIDASVDASLMAVTLPVLTKKGILPKSEASVIASLLIGKAVATCFAKSLGHEIHTVRAGKLANFFWWGGVGLHCTSRVAEGFKADQSSLASKIGARVISWTGTSLGAVSAIEYGINVITPKRP